MKRLIGLILMVLLSTSSHPFEIAFSKEKSSWTKHIASLSFLDPESHQVLQTTVLGEVPNLQKATGFPDEDGGFFYALVPNSGKKPWKIVVFSISDHKEIARLETGTDNHANPEFENRFIRISNDGKQLLVIGSDTKKKWKLDVYDRPSHELNWSTTLQKGVSGAIVLPSGLVAITNTSELGGKDTFTVIDVERRKELITHKFERGTRLRLLPTSTVDRFVLMTSIKTPVERQKDTNKLIYADAVHLHSMDAHTGQLIEKAQLGYEPTLVFMDQQNEFGYFATRRSMKNKGLTLWKIHEGIVEVVMDTDLPYHPTATFVRESMNMATVLCGRQAVIFDLNTNTVSHDFALPVDAVSGFISKNADLIFFREEIGSEVGILDVAKGEVIENAPTGSRGKKFAKVLVNVANVAVGAYIGIYPGFLPFLPIAGETTMMTDKTESSFYVINNSTNDVTIFKTEGLERIKTVPVKWPFMLSYYENSDYMFVLGYGELALINPTSNEVARSYKDGAFAGINEILGNAYFADEEGLKIIDIKSGDVKRTLESPAQIYSVIGPSMVPGTVIDVDQEENNVSGNLTETTASKKGVMITDGN